jgi:uncharacterized membrane protein
MIILGFLRIFVGTALLVLSSLGSGEASGGLVVFIGPIPIAIGFGKQSRLMLLIAALLALAMIILMVVMLRPVRTS